MQDHKQDHANTVPYEDHFRGNVGQLQRLMQVVPDKRHRAPQGFFPACQILKTTLQALHNIRTFAGLTGHLANRYFFQRRPEKKQPLKLNNLAIAQNPSVVFKISICHIRHRNTLIHSLSLRIYVNYCQRYFQHIS